MKLQAASRASRISEEYTRRATTQSVAANGKAPCCIVCVPRRAPRRAVPRRASAASAPTRSPRRAAGARRVGVFAARAHANSRLEWSTRYELHSATVFLYYSIGEQVSAKNGTE
eukprot:4589958-Pleurochrysis_carterae.AAC.5